MQYESHSLFYNLYTIPCSSFVDAKQNSAANPATYVEWYLTESYNKNDIHIIEVWNEYDCDKHYVINSINTFNPSINIIFVYTGALSRSEKWTNGIIPYAISDELSGKEMQSSVYR